MGKHPHHHVADPARHAGQRADLGEPTGERDDVVGDREAFGLITVQQCFAAVAVDHRRQFPGQVERVLHAGVHALAAGRTVDVGGVAGQEDPAPAVGGHPRVADLEAGQPM